jgi:preprotein translocase subunit SecA
LSSKLKSGIYLQQYAQNNPLAEYVEQATTLFNRMKINIASDVINKLANVVLKAVDSEEKPQPIEITDNDIEIIFAETGLDKTMVNNEAINRRFDELEAENQGNSKVLHKLKIQRDIMLGLVIEIEKRFANNQPPKLEVGIEAIESMLRIFGITNPEDAKIELIEERYQQLLKEVENEEEKQEQLKIAKEVLKDFVSQINLFKVAETKKADEDDDGLTKLTKTRMG